MQIQLSGGSLLQVWTVLTDMLCSYLLCDLKPIYKTYYSDLPHLGRSTVCFMQAQFACMLTLLCVVHLSVYAPQLSWMLLLLAQALLPGTPEEPPQPRHCAAVHRLPSGAHGSRRAAVFMACVTAHRCSVLLQPTHVSQCYGCCNSTAVVLFSHGFELRTSNGKTPLLQSSVGICCRC
jgi:hypothetical protein